MQKGEEGNLVNEAEVGPPLTTALQIALFLQFQRLGMTESNVIGHSTGEIAAAYAAALLSLEEAMTIAYYYGYSTRHLVDGAMVAVSMGIQELGSFLKEGVVVACENSPLSTTLSGDRVVLEEVLESIKASRSGFKSSLLHVKVAYHSR